MIETLALSAEAVKVAQKTYRELADLERVGPTIGPRLRDEIGSAIPYDLAQRRVEEAVDELTRSLNAFQAAAEPVVRPLSRVVERIRNLPQGESWIPASGFGVFYVKKVGKKSTLALLTNVAGRLVTCGASNLERPCAWLPDRFRNDPNQGAHVPFAVWQKDSLDFVGVHFGVLPKPVASRLVEVPSQEPFLIQLNCKDEDLTVDLTLFAQVEAQSSSVVPPADFKANASASLTVSVKPTEVASALRALGQAKSDRGIQEGVALAPEETAECFFQALKGVEKAVGPSSLVTLGAGWSMSGGVGVTDTGVALVALGGGVDLSCSLAPLIGFGSSGMRRLLDGVLAMSDPLAKLAAMIDDPDSARETLDEIRKEALPVLQDQARGLRDDLGRLLKEGDPKIVYKISLTAGGKRSTSSGSGSAGTSTTLYGLSITIPVSAFCRAFVKAASAIWDGLSSLAQAPSQVGLAMAEAATGVLRSAEIKLDFRNPVLLSQGWPAPILYGLKLGVGDVVDSAMGLGRVVEAFIEYGRDLADQRATKSSRQALLEAVKKLPSPGLRENLEISQVLQGGIEGSLGAAVSGTLGVGTVVGLTSNLEMLLRCVSLGNRQVQGRSEFGAALHLSQAGQVEAGVANTVQAGGGVKVAEKMTLLEASLVVPPKDKERPLEVQTASGFFLFDFDGSQPDARSFKGSGTLLVPYFGAVRATSLDVRDGSISSGRWASSMSLHGFSAPRVSGGLKADGLHLTGLQLPLANRTGCSLKVDLVVRSDGTFGGTWRASVLGIGSIKGEISMRRFEPVGGLKLDRGLATGSWSRRVKLTQKISQKVAGKTITLGTVTVTGSVKLTLGAGGVSAAGTASASFRGPGGRKLSSPKVSLTIDSVKERRYSAGLTVAGQRLKLSGKW